MSGTETGTAEKRAHGHLRGVVQADARHKTVKVLIERRVKHPLYGKVMRRRHKLLIHDPEEICRAGDTVVVKESRPVSKRKSWVLVRKVSGSQETVQ